MNSGRYIGSILASQHGKAVIDQLGWDTFTFGHWYHGFHRVLSQQWFAYYVIKRINYGRRMAFMKEEEEKRKKAAEEAAKNQ
jgi:hypothetical protein